MNKAELIADLTAKVVAMVRIAQQEDTVKAGAGINVYAAEVMELTGVDKINGRTIGFYVIGEGTELEQAFYKDTISLPVNDNVMGMAYLQSLPFVKFRAGEMRPDLGYFMATVWEENTEGNLTQKEIMVYKNAQGEATHKEII